MSHWIDQLINWYHYLYDMREESEDSAERLVEFSFLGSKFENCHALLCSHIDQQAQFVEVSQAFLCRSWAQVGGSSFPSSSNLSPSSRDSCTVVSLCSAGPYTWALSQGQSPLVCMDIRIKFAMVLTVDRTSGVWPLFTNYAFGIGECLA